MAKLQRMSGILLHPTSLPSPYGIGDLGQSAYDFVDFLEEAGQHLWQTLPLSHTGFGDSPYQSFSAFAGQPLMISPKHFLDLGLIDEHELYDCPHGDETRVNYGDVINWKNRIFHLAYYRYMERGDVQKELGEDLKKFCEDNAFWLDDYALFMTCKDLNQGRCWLDWDDDMRLATAEDRKALAEEHVTAVNYYKFIQFFFFTEWKELKAYANEREVKIIGDIPIFVSMDSADVWANQHLFKLDTKGYPLVVAGVPPDYFSATGQLWGNPLYDWEAHEKDGFSWWLKRIEAQLKNLDILRIDHFRGFESYWAVPYGEDTAINGEWLKAPGKELFSAVQKKIGKDLPIIAEDLGVITDEVTELREYFHFPGMKILQFAFDGTGESSYLPHQFTSPECVCYTGTHDNDTTNGWYSTLAYESRQKVQAYTCCYNDHDITRGLMRVSMASIAAYSITPLQDVLRLGSEGRMNRPAISAGNWNWRFRAGDLYPELARELREMTKLYGRLDIS